MSGAAAMFFDLEAVFANAFQHDGKMFCGRAYMVRMQRSILFYPSRDASRARYDIALVPLDAPRELWDAGGDGFVLLRGKLSVERDCFLGHVETERAKTAKCVPIKRPIFIELRAGRVANF